MTPNERLRQIREEWLHEEHILQKGEDLLAKREELQQNEEALDRAVQANLLTIQQKQAEEAEEIKRTIDSQLTLLREVKEKKQKVDHLLDSFEESSQKKVGLLKAQLAEAILRKDSSQMESYEKMQKTMARQALDTEELNHTVQVCENLIQLIAAATEARQAVKRRGILSYIFGSNPNVVISRALHEAHTLATSALPVIRENSKESLKNSYEELALFLESFAHECKERWGFKKVDALFSRASERLRTFKSIFQQELEAIHKQEDTLQQNFHEWLKKNSEES